MNVLMIDSLPLFVAGVADALLKLDQSWKVWPAQNPEDVYRLRDQIPESGIDAVTLEWDEAAAQVGWPNVLPDALGNAPWLFVVRVGGRHAIADALLAGAAGVVERHATADEFAEALRQVASGAIYLPSRYRGGGEPPARPQASSAERRLERLTPRQLEVLRLLAEGKSNKQICRVLNVAEGTIKNHLYALFRQIGVSNRTEAALWLARRFPAESPAFARAAFAGAD
ncbi:helix-turn-helix transcriptional regulator [Trinickia fusca]|uniref:DNA-binding response regulator n=1 Tax=Trinickia fusca TaxID=2419777 RepID=A0A494X8U8_9BURK|nr:response regulator transcription factor [Trinickia fusca]RKP44614.1 DNA-binding response regulator [Trinickia fusca]